MAIDYVARIATANAAELSRMLDTLAEGRQIRGWARGKAFEHIILRGFALEGAEVRWPFEVRYQGQALEQIDGVIYSDGLACLIEAKDYSEPINVEAVAKMRNQLMRRPAGTFGIVFARSGFTEPAKALIRWNAPLNVLLWEYPELRQAIRDGAMRRALTTKYNFAIEQGIPDYSILGGYL